jgi:hypothetical protein
LELFYYKPAVTFRARFFPKMGLSRKPKREVINNGRPSTETG